MDSTARLGPYEIKGSLADLGFEDLYLGRDARGDGTEVVIRALPVFVDEEAIIERLRERALRVKALGHPGLAGLSRIKKSDGVVLAIAPRPEGRALDRFLPAEGLLSRDVFDLSLMLCDALAALHGADQVHGYLHAGRVVVNDERRPVLMVIGPEEAERILPPRVAACSAPEVLAGDEVDARAEVFSLGALLYQVATGELPFGGDSADEVAESVRNDDPVPVNEARDDLPRELAVIVARCLKKDRELRYGSVKEVHDALVQLKDDIIAGKVATPRRSTQEPKPEKDEDSDAAEIPTTASVPAARPAAAALDWRLGAAAVLLVLLAFAGGYLLGGDGSSSATGLDPMTFARATSEAGPELFPRLSADGGRVFYARADDGDWGIWTRARGDARAVELTADSPYGDSQPALSPDGSTIAFRSERDGGGIFLMSADGSDVRRLSPSGYNPSWSPSGDRIVVAEMPVYDVPYSGVQGGLVVIDVASGTTRPLAGADGLQPAWSPGGARIAYWESRAGNASDIWTVAADGGEPVTVTVDAHQNWAPAWSPDGSYLYFSSNRSGSTEIWRVSVDESSGTAEGPPEQVTAGASTRAIHASFARDTGTLAYVEASERRLLYRIPFDPSARTVTGSPQPLSRLPQDAHMPHLSADGTRIAFVRRAAGTEQIHIADLDGNRDTPVAAGDAGTDNPRLSPDGDRVAFIAEHDGYPQLWTADLSDGTATRLTELTTRRLSQPVWSRDGSGIAMTVGGQLTPSYTLLFAAGAAPEEQVARTLYSSSGDALFVPHSWSRDGARLAGSVRDRDGRPSGIGVLTVGNGNFEQLTTWGLHPVWLRDGRRLLFQWGGSLYLLDSRNPDPRHLFSAVPDVLGEVFSLSSDDRWIYVSLEHKEGDTWLLNR